MADASLELQMSLKDNKVQTGLDALARKEDDVAKAAKKIAAEARKADQELDRFAKRTKDINATPVERYEKLVTRLTEALRKGKLSQDDYARAVARAKSELEKATAVTTVAATEQQKLFGPQAVGQLNGLVGGYFTLQAAVNLVGDAFRYAREESEQALGSLRGLDDARRRLNQIATSPEDLQAKMSRADAAAGKYGVDRKDAYSLLFDVYNYGIEGDYEKLMAGRSVFDPRAAGKVGGKLQSLFPGLTAMEGVNMTLQAAAASEMDFEEFAGAMPMAGEGARIAKASPEETMAAVSVLAAQFKSGQVAADRIKNFGTKVGLAGPTAGKGLLGSLDALQAMSPEEREEILKKDQETNAAYLALVENEALIRQRMTQISAARGGAPLAEAIARGAATPQMRAVMQVQQGEVGLELTREEELAGGAAGRKTARDMLQSGLIRRGGSTFGRFLGDKAMSGMEAVGLGPMATIGAGLVGGAAGDVHTNMLRTAIDPVGGAKGYIEMLGRGFELGKEAVGILRDIRDQGQRPTTRDVQNQAGRRPS